MKQPLNLLFLIPFFFLMLSNSRSLAQNTQLSNLDTLLLTNPRSLYSFWPEKRVNIITLNSKKIKIPFVNNNSLFRFISVSNVNEQVIKFKNCYFGNIDHMSLPKIHETSNNKRLEFDSCALRYLTLTKQENETAIYNCDIGVLHIDSSNNYSLRINNSRVTYSVFIENSRQLSLDLQSVGLRDSGTIKIHNSTITDFTFFPSHKKGSKLFFIEDTLLQHVSTYFSPEEHITRNGSPSETNLTDTLFFSNCHINCYFQLLPNNNNLVLEFNNCTFGQQADLGEISVTGITFQNCTFHTNGVRLSTNEDYNTDLTLINTDVNYLRFNFPSSVKLTFPPAYYNGPIK